jgi:hypothetical protein
MKRAMFAILLLGIASAPHGIHAQGAGELGGQWALDRAQSDFPKEIGFTADWLNDAIAAAEAADAAGRGGGAPAGGRGGRRGGGAGVGRGAVPNRQPPRESLDDAERVAYLTNEVRTPPARLTIVDTAAAVTVTGDNKQPRIFHPNGRIEALDVSSTVTTELTAARELGRLFVTYHVEPGRQLRYTYSRVATPERLIVDVEFIEPKGGGDKVRLVYDRPGANDTASTSTTPPATPAAQRADGSAAQINQQPDAALKGLTQLGVVVEDLSPQAAACGLKQDALQAMVTKRLTDAGLRVIRYSDEDTYIYVNVVTTSTNNGLCVSRYDVDVIANTAGKLTYSATPVLLQAQLLHKGGLAGSAAATHGDSVSQGVQEYVDAFAARIRNANK